MWKNILRTMVKTPAQTKGRLKSYGQKTVQIGPFLKMALFGQFFGHNFLTVLWFELGFSPLFLEYFSTFLRFFAKLLDNNFFWTHIVILETKCLFLQT